MRLCFWLLALIGLICSAALAQLPGAPPWRGGAVQFTTADGVIYADGVPFVLNYDFTWSAGLNEDLYKFALAWGNTATWVPVGVNVTGAFDFAQLDKVYAAAASGRNYFTWSGSVAHEGGYLRQFPEAAQLEPSGARAENSAVCFLNPGYREALGRRLAEVAQSLAGRPFHLGYYPQDEFAYRGWGCCCPLCKAQFRQRMQEKYGTVAALNQAWETNLTSFDQIEPPEKPEKTVRFCDWQEFRRWAQLDFARFVYQTLKQHDPHHLVIWSLPFWGGVNTTAAWWDFPRVSDILMRHGIGFQSGVYRIHLLRDVAEWSGKPGSALCMPPDYYPGFIQMMLLMDCPRTGLSHVCIAGEPHPTYQGVADSTRDWERREPGFTVSKSINDVIYQMGDLYLLSKQRAPQVGVYVSDRTVLVNGINTRDLNGLLQLLTDLNVDLQIFSEHNLDQLEGYPVVLVAAPARCVSDEIAARFARYVAGGGRMIMFDGAFAADWYNRDTASPGLGFAEVIGSTERARENRTAAVTLGSDKLVGLPAEAPASGSVSIREPAPGCEVVGVMGPGEPVVTLHRYGQGEVLYAGVAVGTVYNASWQEGFREVITTDERAAAVDDNAYGSNYRPPAGEALPPAKGYKAWAELVRSFLRRCGVTPYVEVAGYTEGIGVVRVKSFRQGNSYWVGLANRLTNPGVPFREVHERHYHQPLHDVTVRVRLDDGPTPEIAWLPPLTEHTEDTRAALPQVLPVQVVERDGARWAQVTVPEVVYGAVVVLMQRDTRPAVVGASLTPSTISQGGQVTLTGTVINTCAQPIAGNLQPGLMGGLVYAGAPQPFRLQPGEQTQVEFTLLAPEGIAPDFYQMNVVASLEGGQQVVSPSVELRVLRDITVELAREQTIFPAGHLPATVSADIVVNSSQPVELTARVETPPGFAAQPAQIPLGPLMGGQRRSVEFSFTAPDRTPRVAEGALVLSGRLRGKPYEWRHPLRFACGTVVYYKDEYYKLHATMEPTQLPLLCLENSHVLATIIENGGIVHDLVLRDTNMDHLVPSPYPFGWVWYGWRGGWSKEEVSPCSDDGVWARLRGTAPDGKPVTMTFSLGADDDFLKIAIETGDAGPVQNAFYLMSRIGADGSKSAVYWPTAAGVQSLGWGKGRRNVPAGDLAEKWLAMRDEPTDQTFGCVFDFPALDSVSLQPGLNGFHYMIFSPKADVPIGDITFYLYATQGGVEQVRTLSQRLLGGG